MEYSWRKNQPMKETVDQICADLREGNRAAVKRVVAAIGVDPSLTLLQQTLELETNGGMLTRDGQRRRTPGGVFFQLARAVVPKDLHPQVFPMPYVLRREKRRREQASRQNERAETGAAERKERQDSSDQEATAPATSSESEQRMPAQEKAVRTPAAPVQRAPVAPPMTWEEAKALIAQSIKTPGEAKTVKFTLIGRPLKVMAQPECVVVSLKGKEPPSLPKGLPPIPEGSATTWAVFVVTKQWHKVKASIEQHTDDQLIIEGYPLVGKNGVAAVMALNCKSVLLERAQREKQATA
jgi:hypothetical protein